MGFPSFNRANAGPAAGFPPVGEYDVYLNKAEYKTSGGGSDMLQAEFVIDTGSEAGGKVPNNFVFNTKSGFGERMLQAFANRARKDDGSLDPTLAEDGTLAMQKNEDGTPAVDDEGNPVPVNLGGFVFSSEVSSWREFCGQFKQSPPLRVRVRISHQYSVKQGDGSWKRYKSLKEFQESPDSMEDPFVQVNIDRFVGPPSAPSSLAVPQARPAQAPANAFPQPSVATPAPAGFGDGAAYPF